MTSKKNNKGGMKGVKKTQSSIEYLSTFSISFLVLVLVVIIVGLILFNGRSTTYTTSTCYISAQLNCIQFAIGNNGVQTDAVLVFTNNLGTPISFGANAISVLPTPQETSHVGNCYPANVPSGGVATCNVTLLGYGPAVGTQLQPRFQITYSECTGTGCSSINTSGSSNLYVSPSLPSYAVTLLTVPSTGGISVEGVEYNSGSVVVFLPGISYGITADGPNGAPLEYWSTQSGVSVQNTHAQSTTASATSSGVLEAVFACYTITTSANPAGGGSENPNISSSGGCPGSYIQTTKVSLQATPSSGYIFTGWTGSGTGSYTGPANPATVTAESNINEVANYASTATTSVYSPYQWCLKTFVSPSYAGSVSPTGITCYDFNNYTQMVFTSDHSTFNEWTSNTTFYSSSCSIPASQVNTATANIECNSAGTVYMIANAVPYVNVSITENPTGAAGAWSSCFMYNTNNGQDSSLGATSGQVCAGHGTASNSILVPVGSTIDNICASNYAGTERYAFSSWTGVNETSTNGLGSCYNGGNNPTITLTKSVELQANYDACYVLNIMPPSGEANATYEPPELSISNVPPCNTYGTYSYDSGNVVVVTILPTTGFVNPASGSYITTSGSTTGLQVQSASSGSQNGNSRGSNTYSFTMTQNYTEYVHFLLESPTVCVSTPEFLGSFTAQCSTAAYGYNRSGVVIATPYAYTDGFGGYYDTQGFGSVQSYPCDATTNSSTACVLAAGLNSNNAGQSDSVVCTLNTYSGLSASTTVQFTLGETSGYSTGPNFDSTISCQNSGDTSISDSACGNVPGWVPTLTICWKQP